MEMIVAVLMIVGIAVAYAALLKLLQAPENPLEKALRRNAINRTVRRELVDLDHRYAVICGGELETRPE